MLLKRIDLELRRWIADERREEPEVADAYRVFIARTVGPLLAKAKKGDATINERQGRALVGTLEAMGLGCLVPQGITFGKEAEAEKEAAETKGGKGGKGKKDDKKASGGKKDKDGKKSKEEEKEDKGAKLSFSFVSFKKGDYGFMKIAEDPLEWQMRCMGEFMARELDSRPDPR
jgi:ATP-dependent RNA helicase DDX60